MKITIKGTEKEIADFVLAVQNQQYSNDVSCSTPESCMTREEYERRQSIVKD